MMVINSVEVVSRPKLRQSELAPHASGAPIKTLHYVIGETDQVVTDERYTHLGEPDINTCSPVARLSLLV
ncbi:serine hydrolase family protein [Candidatus Nitrotoga sp. BS]|uniref:serine hydrolase family protein n=1 Tax=Candidatus Nitrotoga sp. BS TaxID=2890408 RepID=UPI001EF358C6|nr:serine hydrolase family protein [Candidatus Nitrotoga sp. BS]